MTGEYSLPAIENVMEVMREAAKTIMHLRGKISIARKPDAVANLALGLIDYTTLERVIEYAATRGPHDVVLMGEEHLTPVGKARFAGKQVKRRTTEIWSDESGEWKLVVRQATIYSAE